MIEKQEYNGKATIIGFTRKNFIAFVVETAKSFSVALRSTCCLTIILLLLLPLPDPMVILLLVKFFSRRQLR